MQAVLADHEKEVAIIRRSGVVFLFETFVFVLATFVVPFLVKFVGTHVVSVSFSGDAAGVPRALQGLWYLFMWVTYFIRLTNYLLDYWIVTTERLMKVEQRSLFSRDASTLSLEKIQDVTVEVHGIFATLFHFGTLFIQSAGETREFRMTGVSRPIAAKETIMKLAQAKADEIKRVEVVQ